MPTKANKKTKEAAKGSHSPLALLHDHTSTDVSCASYLNPSHTCMPTLTSAYRPMKKLFLFVRQEH